MLNEILSTKINVDKESFSRKHVEGQDLRHPNLFANGRNVLIKDLSYHR